MLTFFDNIWGADLADMQLISKFDKDFRFLLCVINKYACVVPLKVKKEITIANAFQKILDASSKPSKVGSDKVSEFYNRPMK